MNGILNRARDGREREGKPIHRKRERELKSRSITPQKWAFTVQESLPGEVTLTIITGSKTQAGAL